MNADLPLEELKIDDFEYGMFSNDGFESNATIAMKPQSQIPESVKSDDSMPLLKPTQMKQLVVQNPPSVVYLDCDNSTKVGS